MLPAVDREQRRKWLANRLLELRAKRNWDQSAVKKASRGTISKLENSKMNVTVIKLEAILEAYGMSLEEFFTGTKVETPSLVERRLAPGRRDEDKERAGIIEKFGRKTLLEMIEGKETQD